MRAVAGVQDFYNRLASATHPECLTSGDMLEFTKILHHALQARSHLHKVSPGMIKSFVTRIFEDWHCPTELISIRPLQRLPYSCNGNRTNGRLIVVFINWVISPTDGEFQLRYLEA